jgi:hypothetical protein
MPIFVLRQLLSNQSISEVPGLITLFKLVVPFNIKLLKLISESFGPYALAVEYLMVKLNISRFDMQDMIMIDSYISSNKKMFS